MISQFPTRQRGGHAALLPKGECAVLGIQLRELIATLPALEQQRMLMDLRRITERYTPRGLR